jgi:hypothetical protein
MYFSITKVMQFLIEKFPTCKNIHFYFEPKNTSTHEFGVNLSPVGMVIEEQPKNICLSHEKLVELFEEQPFISFKPNETSRKLDLDLPMQILTIKNKQLRFGENEYYNSSLSTPKNESLVQTLLKHKLLVTIIKDMEPLVSVEDFF